MTPKRFFPPVILLFLSFSLLFCSCNKGSVAIDIEGNEYSTILIGDQEWFVDNLRTTTYNDGVGIPTAQDSADWSALTTGAYTVFPHSLIDGLNAAEEVLEHYGALYNYYTVETGKLCPAGWRVPTREDWDILIDYVGGESIGGGKLKSVRTVPDPHPRWNRPNTGATDDWGFKALPSDHRTSKGEFFFVGSFAVWWTSTEADAEKACDIALGFISNAVTRDSVSKKAGFAIRCMRDVPSEEQELAR